MRNIAYNMDCMIAMKEMADKELQEKWANERRDSSRNLYRCGRPKIKRINSKKFRKLQKQAIRKKLEENND